MLRHCRPGVRRQGDESGFTLIELLVVVVVLPLLMGGVAAMIMTVFQNTAPKDPAGTSTRLADSRDAQLSSAYFVRDVQGASLISTSSVPLCAPVASPGEQLLGLEWLSGTSTVDVTYAVEDTAPPSLVRNYCVSPTTPSSFPVAPMTSTPVAPHIFSNLAVATVGACPSSVGAFGSGGTTCALSGGSAYAVVSIACFGAGPCDTGTDPGLSVSPTSPGGPGVATVSLQVKESLSGYRYSLTAAPRSSNSSGGGNPSPTVHPPFISNGPVDIGNCNILVDGIVAVNDPNPGAVSLGPQGSDTSTAIYTTDPDPSGSVTGKGSYPKPVIYGNPVSSPYDSLAEPPTAPSGAPYKVVTETTPEWDPSTDPSVETNGVLDPSPNKYPGGAIFIVTNGMTISKKFSAPQGVLFYVEGGNVDIHGNGTLDLNSLTPSFESPSQPTPEVVLWISRNDLGTSGSPTLTLSGNANSTLINGAIYAPTTALTMNGGGHSGGVNAESLDVGSLAACHGGGSVAHNITINPTPTSGVTLTPASPSIPLGGSEVADAAVQGASRTSPTGTVTFFQCGPLESVDGCDQVTDWGPVPAGTAGSNQVGVPVALTGTTGDVSTVTSDPFSPTSAGVYCFAAYYSGDGTYANASDTTSDGCFTVAAATPTATIDSPTDSSKCYSARGSGGCDKWPADAITGTAADPGGPGISSVVVTIERAGNPGSWWNGTSFSSPTTVNLTPVDTSGNGSWATWNLALPASAFPSGNSSYTITVRGTDKNGLTGPAQSSNISWKN